VKRDGKDVVVIEHESVIQVELLRQNLASFLAQRAEIDANIRQTEEMISEVEAIAPDLLEAAAKAAGLSPIPKSRQRKRATKRKNDKAKKRRAG
jgi:chaperonin cofactor prefoldin